MIGDSTTSRWLGVPPTLVKILYLFSPLDVNDYHSFVLSFHWPCDFQHDLRKGFDSF